MRKVIAFCGYQGCVDAETEFLTKKGWKKISNYNDNDEIGIYNLNGILSFEHPLNYINEKATRWVILKSKHGIDQKLSENHSVYYITSKNNIYSKSALEVYNNHQQTKNGFRGRFITTFKLSERKEMSLSDNLIRLYVAIQADGQLLKFKDSIVVNLKKSRKKERLEYLLKEERIPFTYTDGKDYNTNKGYRKYRFRLEGCFKEFPDEWWKMSTRQFSIIADEVIFWDGSWEKSLKNRGKEYFSNSKKNADFIQFVFTSTGHKSSIYTDTHRLNINYAVRCTNDKFSQMHPDKQGAFLEEPLENERKYCFTTSTGMWVARRNNKIFITGNSGKSYSTKRLMMTMGFVKTSFANSLRDIAFNTIGMTLEDGMKNYDELKKTELINGLTFRNILENLGASVRKYDKDFWARGVLKFIQETPKNVCIDDLRYPNEYKILKDYCSKNGIDFKLVFCDYHSETYRDDNPHESAQLARYLKKLGYQDQDYVDELDVLNFELLYKDEK